MSGPDTDTLAPIATPRSRAKARHILDHYYIGPARDPEVLEIWGYTERFSYRPGEVLELTGMKIIAARDLPRQAARAVRNVGRARRCG